MSARRSARAGARSIIGRTSRTVSGARQGWNRRIGDTVNGVDTASPEAIQDSIAGRTAFYMAPINSAIGQFKDGKLTALRVSTRQRADMLPNMPSIAEQGYKDYDISLWFGMWALAGTPPAIVQKLNAQVASVLQIPELRKQFAKLGISPVPMKPDEFAKFLRAEIATNQRIVRRAGIEPL